jgi:hypothetical protein
MVSNDPRLVASLALAKAQALEERLNGLVAQITPQTPSIIYTPTTTVVTESSNGAYTWTCPAGVTSAYVECWGAGGGGGGGSSTKGGEAGGGGEYAAEPAYAVVPGQVYNFTVGAGGAGGATNNAGVSGNPSQFDNDGVFASAGAAGPGGFIGGPGGSGSSNTIEWPGGNGGGDDTQSTGGCGGGGSGGQTGAGANGSLSSSSTGAAAGAGGSGTSGNGGAGGNSGASGSNGSGPGGGGGGAGTSSGSTQFSQDWQPTASGTFYGADANGGNANKRRDVGTCYQGGESASNGGYNGTMKSQIILPSGIAATLSGATIDKVQLRLLNLGSWYSSGMYVVLGYGNMTYLGTAWSGSGITAVKTFWIDNNNTLVVDLTSTGLGAALKSGAATALTLGPGSPDMDTWNYGWFYGAGGATGSVPDLRVEWHTGSAPEYAGNGSDGQVQITYVTQGVLTAALQPSSGTDTGGNAFTSGYTGPVTAIQPGSNPAVVEVQHSLSSYLVSATWSVRGGGYLAQYYMLSNGRLHLDFELTASGLAGGNYQVTTALPAGYRPTFKQDLPISWNSANAAGTNPPALACGASNGIFTANNLPAATTVIMFSGNFSGPFV